MDKYTVEKALGAGSFGEISLVRSRKNGTLYVCKRIDWSNKTARQQEDSENEVRAMAKLNHPNIVGFIAAFLEKKTLHIIMEYADQGDLERELCGFVERNEMLSEKRIMHLFVQIALGLRQVHKQHLIHRDLKSANVFVTSKGHLKLGDFGFAKQLNYTLALTNTVCGTPYYFAPEICQRLPYNNKIDVWSLGVILYEMINLQKPFEAKSLPELRKRVVNEDPSPFVAEHVSQELQDLCMLLLTKKSADRPSLEMILQLPYVRGHLEAFNRTLSVQETNAASRSSQLAAGHARKPGEAAFTIVDPAGGDAPEGRATFGKLTIDPAQLKQLKTTGQTPAEANAPTRSDGAALNIFNQVMPDPHSRVSNACPMSVVAQITEELLEEQASQALQTEIHEVLTASISFDDCILGEAESDEERMLRKELGDNFEKCIELALEVQELGLTSPQAELKLRQLLNILGPKAYLLADVETVASFFWVEK